MVHLSALLHMKSRTAAEPAVRAGACSHDGVAELDS